MDQGTLDRNPPSGSRVSRERFARTREKATMKDGRLTGPPVREMLSHNDSDPVHTTAKVCNSPRIINYSKNCSSAEEQFYIATAMQPDFGQKERRSNY